MTYTDIISLEDAKDYLGIDDTSRDNEIRRMIRSAFQYVEKRTNVIMIPKEVTYYPIEGCVRVYDYPINTLDADLPEDITVTKRALYNVYNIGNLEEITLNVGSSENCTDLIEAVYMLIEHYFEEGQRSQPPSAVEDVINVNRRFIL
jgi:hypothetical protein